MKKNKKYAIVRTVATFYHVYAVPYDKLQELNPDDEVSHEWLKDAVTCEDVEELGQKYLGEQIIESDVVNEDEMLKIFDDINGYLSSWNDEQKINFVRKLIDVKP